MRNVFLELCQSFIQLQNGVSHAIHFDGYRSQQFVCGQLRLKDRFQQFLRRLLFGRLEKNQCQSFQKSNPRV